MKRDSQYQGWDMVSEAILASPALVEPPGNCFYMNGHTQQDQQNYLSELNPNCHRIRRNNVTELWQQGRASSEAPRKESSLLLPPSGGSLWAVVFPGLWWYNIDHSFCLHWPLLWVSLCLFLYGHRRLLLRAHLHPVWSHFTLITPAKPYLQSKITFTGTRA